MTNRFSESQAKALALEAQERLNESRRGFFKVLGVGAAAASGLSAAVFSPEALAYGGPFAPAFGLDPGRTFMNIGTTGSTPIPVLKNLAANNAAIARDPTLTFNTQDMRNIIAPGFGADPFELVMSFNTTDGMNKILNGLNFSAGDEIITTNMEHPGGNSPMQVVSDRLGVVLRRVNLPTSDVYSDALVLSRFQALRTNRTKAIVYSSPPYLTGIRLPEKMLNLWAAANGIWSVHDGAHIPGMIAFDMHDSGIDFFAGAGHKWQCGPGQTGIMYVRNGTSATPYTKSVTTAGVTSTITVPGYSNTTPLAPFWPVGSGGYSATPGTALQGGVRDPADNIAATLMSIGNPSYPALRALQECCQLWDMWGRKTIETYDLSLAQYLRSRLAAIWGNRSMATPYDANLPHHAQVALTSFNPFSPGYDYNADLTPAQATQQTTASTNAVNALRDVHKIVIRNTATPHTLRSNPNVNAAADAFSHPLRISTHLFHTPADVDNLVTALLATVPHP
ncbi:aminotransferase class V-fold PLP-dependent enzyme [Piscinibacter koreensis]|uniref:Aminotransferase class V-fold PLP-dependent enzyme n=1 Tax=Piscinibacter koreensis TaxID=2742824 RepID=A0A7Y6NTL2_9BURK|nr:aminotransferase class V-fold PLP-dependent enzyme [Schlegelella koreensis]NUZ09059.1 aminotransferase class V-fold PLP-dependent enzyme [Schlegelella koreensis]